MSSSASSASGSSSRSVSPAVEEPVAPAPTLKRKRTGATRALAKQAAIQRAQEEQEQAQNGEAAQSASAHDHVEDGGASGPSTQKRKMADDEDAGEEQDEQPGLDIEGIIHRIPQALKTLHTAIKKTKVSETQRLIKKLRFLRGKSAPQTELDDLENQLEELKHLDIHPLPAHLLHLKLRKHPQLHRLPAADLARILAAVGAPSESPGVDERVRNRLYSAKGVAGEVPGVLGWVVGSEGAKLVRPAGKSGKPGNKVAEKQAAMGTAPAIKRDADRPVSAMATPAKKAKMDDVPDTFEDDIEDERADAAGWESGSVDDAGSDQELGESDESEDESADEPAAPPVKPSKARASKPAAPPAKPPARAPAKPITSNLFLPSLSGGYTMGDGSDFSDPEEDERRDKKKGLTVERKNRRGQRERRAIWEKKYGTNAAHVKKQQEEEKNAELAKKFLTAQGGKWAGKSAGDAGWGQRASQAKPGAPKAAPARPAAATPAAVSQPSSATADKAKTMHPSWEAARLRKEKEQALATAPKAKKIVFD